MPFGYTLAEVADPRLRAQCPRGAHAAFTRRVILSKGKRFINPPSLPTCQNQPHRFHGGVHTHNGPARVASFSPNLSVAVVKLDPSYAALPDPKLQTNKKTTPLTPCDKQLYQAQLAGWPVGPRPDVSKCHLFVQGDMVARPSLSPRKHWLGVGHLARGEGIVITVPAKPRGGPGPC